MRNRDADVLSSGNVVDFPLRAPNRAGRYDLTVDMLRQLIAWFGGEGGTPVHGSVEVVEDPLP